MAATPSLTQMYGVSVDVAVPGAAGAAGAVDGAVVVVLVSLMVVLLSGRPIVGRPAASSAAASRLRRPATKCGSGVPGSSVIRSWSNASVMAAPPPRTARG